MTSEEAAAARPRQDEKTAARPPQDQETPAQPPQGETAARPRRHGDIVLAAAIAMIAVQLVWRFDFIRRTYFRQDDFTFIARGLEHGLTWDYLMRVDYGHLMPGPFAIHWAMGRVGVYNDVLAHLVTLGLLAAAAFALLRLLRLLFGTRPAILVPLGFYLLTPLLVSSLSWWAVVIETLPFQIALAMALGSQVRFARTGRFRHALAVAAWAVLAMVFFVKAPFILVLAFVLTIGWFPGARRRAGAWLLHLAVVAGYAVVFFRQLFTSVQLTNDTVRPAFPDPGVAASFAWKLLSAALVPGALGGPWQWYPISEDYAIAAAPQALAWAALGVAVLAVGVSLWYRRRAWLAWLTLLGYFVLADVVPVMIGRIVQLGPDLGGQELRYVSSTAMLLAVVIGLAYIPVLGERAPWRRPAPGPRRLPWVRAALRYAWVPVAAAFFAGSVWTAVAYTRMPLGDHVKSYVATGRAALARAPINAVILDAHVPARVVLPLFFRDYALVSRVLGPVAPNPVTWTRRLTGPVANPLAFDDAGRLRPVDIQGMTIPQRGGCTPVSSREKRFRLPAAVPDGEWTVQVGYLNPTPSTIAVRLGGGVTTVPAGKDFGWTFATVKGGGADVAIRTLDGRTVCVGEIRLGVPRPAANGTPTPLQPVGP
ncbi:hypothetical protein HTZ77_01140 [Nonomuraea sp. SMC257]|uniref:DUF2079 domain-containing protein n=1 Tax=Nonomuraea montanisoli TaxID=2741721 RepID=A0A7Y6I226_9ACTN|nr:hypothetical protein [Nonomuraea montanisoli]NUW30041.1 hypothetical protein [Nonomuraea montanisoli]